jgi:hypothetical protein
MKLSDQYLAGLFDGEGCIDLQRMYAKPPYDKKVYVRPRVRMCMSDNTLFLAAHLQAEFGGHIGRRQPQNAQQQSSWSLEWLSKDDITAILTRILPYLVLKGEQAKLALWWLDKASGRSNQSGMPGMDQAREVLQEEFRAMKRDPQRLSERAIERISQLMRQSDPIGDGGRVVEIPTPLTIARKGAA